jgi:leader peptidase (prepilin peptidase) / N-methyltransferase
LIEWTIPVLAGVYGLLIGSFLNVCSLRWPVDESVVRPRSKCPKCDAVIAWYDNIPVASWLVLRGRCRSCGVSVSMQYPLVELTTALMWAGAFALHGPSWEALRGSVFLTMLFGISISDARFYIIPDQFSIGGAVIGFGMSFLAGGIGWTQSLMGAAAGYGVLWFVGVTGTWMIKRLQPGRLEEAGVDQAMGGGDIKMMAMVGSFVGLWGVALTIFLGSVVALVTILVRSIFAMAKSGTERDELERLIPFGVFLAAGGGVAWVWGAALVNWYLSSVIGL